MSWLLRAGGRFRVVMIKHVVQYSGGVCSFFAAKRVIAKFGRDGVVLLFADTMIEDQDLYRFLDDTERHLGVPLLRIADGRNPWQVFKDERMIGNSQFDPCSKILKRELLWDWMQRHAPHAVVYVGLDWTEDHRLERLRGRQPTWRIEAPMAWKPLVDKPDMLVQLAKLGIEPCRLYAQGYPHANCFAGDEKFITSTGLKTFAETAGKRVRVIGKNGGWKDAEIKSFGRQRIYGLVIERYDQRRVILTTLEHRWFVRLGRKTERKERRTCELKPGDRLFAIYAQLIHSVRPSAFGIAHGIVFGDGCAPVMATGQVSPANVTLCGLKDRQLLKWFPNSPASEVPGIGIVVRDLPRFWKQPPPMNESQSYLYGWLSGYFAADGTVSSGQFRISSAERANLEYVEAVCARLGIATNEIDKEWRSGFGQEKSALYSIALVPSTLRPDFFLIEEHRKRFEGHVKKRPAEWAVVEVVDSGEEADVFCAVVEDGQVFALQRNILTHNCGGFCIKAGQSQFRLLLQVNRALYLWHEAQEEELRSYLQKDVAILRDRRGGVTRPMTLRAFRERIELGGEHERHDWGGCGCAID